MQLELVFKMDANFFCCFTLIHDTMAGLQTKTLDNIALLGYNLLVV